MATVVTQQVAPQVFVSNPQNPRGLNTKAINGLGITQIVFGVLTVLFGIGSVAGFSGYWVNSSGSGIWFGIWITITGVIGVLSAKKPEQTSLNGCNMGFNIVCTVVSFFVGIFFIVALVFYSNCNTYYNNYYYHNYYYNSCYGDKGAGTAVYAILTLLMVAEFFVSMTISILCCQKGCCTTYSQRGVVIHQQQVPTVINTSTGGVVVSQAGYPAVSYPQGSVPYTPHQGYPPQSTGVYPPQGYPGQQPFMTSAPMGQGAQPAYSAGYQQDPSKVAPPPAYTA